MADRRPAEAPRDLKAVDAARKRRRLFQIAVLPLTGIAIVLCAVLIGPRLIKGGANQGPNSADSASYVYVASAEASAELTPRAPVISVEGTRISVDGVVVDDGSSVLAAQRMLRLDDLFTALKTHRMVQDPTYDPMSSPPRRAILRASTGTPAVVLKSVIQTAAFAGYGEVDFDAGG